MIVSVVADGGWMVVVLAVGVGLVLAADDGQSGGVVSSWYRLMLVTVLKVKTLLAAVEVAAVVVVVVIVVVVVVVAAMVKVVLSSWNLSSGLLYDCSHQLCWASVSVLSKQPTGRSPFCCL